MDRRDAPEWGLLHEIELTFAGPQPDVTPPAT
jgi:hypothetical protein